MTKRKRNRTRDFSARHERPIKKARLEPKDQEQTQRSRCDHYDAGSYPSTSVPSKTGKLTPIPDTESSNKLGRRQRKRQRKRQRRQQMMEQMRPAPQAQHRQPRASIDRSVLTSFGTTTLMKIPTRRWNEAESREIASAATLASLNQEGFNDSAIGTDLPSHPPVPIRCLAKSSDLSHGRRSTPIETTSTGSKPPVQSDAQNREQPPVSRPGDTQTRFRNITAPVLGKKKAQFARKANSVPTATARTNAAVSFHRFTAFLEDSDDESNDSNQDDTSNASESDLYTASVSVVTEIPKAGSVSAEQQHQQNGPQSSLLDAKFDAADLHPPQPSSAEVPPDGDMSQPSQESPIPSSSTPGAWPANIGVKRDSSPTTTRSKPPAKPIDWTLNETQNSAESEIAVSFAGLPFSSIRSDGDASEDLSRTIDEITSAVLSDTRPLPACKRPVSFDPNKRLDRKNGLTSNGFSDCRLTHVTKYGILDLDQPSLFAPDAARQDVIVCNTVRMREGDMPGERAADTSDDERPVPDHVARIDGSPMSKASSSSSSLDEMSRSPSPPAFWETDLVTGKSHGNGTIKKEYQSEGVIMRKRKMTGMTSKHFTPERKQPRSRGPEIVKTESVDDVEVAAALLADGQEAVSAAQTPLSPPPTIRRTQRKGTARKSSYFTPTKPPLDPNIIDRVDFYNTTAGVRSKSAKRVPAGTSTAPVPPITSERFGIIQEKLWKEPFWLLIAVTFLNKTTGRAAVPVFWKLKEKYQTPEQLAAASQEELEGLVWHLGLQRQRSKRLIKMAQAWVETPPEAGARWRTLHYPSKGDGKAFKSAEAVEEDADECAGALEIGQIPGCGPYAWDSWRIFCRDLLRGVAQDYNGGGAVASDEVFEPEWKKVLPGDKELRACLRWMWLREGWIWNCETGEKRRATDEEMAMALKGEMEINDEQERKFAAQAAGVDLAQTEGARAADETTAGASRTSPTITTLTTTPIAAESSSRLDTTVPTTPISTKAVRRSARLSAAAST